MTQEIGIAIEDVIGLMRERYTLIYVDYGDNLSGQLDKVQNAIQTQEWHHLDEAIDDWWRMEAEDYSIDHILKELKEEVAEEFDLDEEDVEEFFYVHKDHLRQVIQDRDESTILTDMMRQTEDPVMFYDTGLGISSSMFDSELFEENLAEIKEILDIQTDKYNKKLELMLAQASFGGRLVIYFRQDIREMMKIGNNNVIIFKNPVVAIIDTFNGSGDHTYLPEHTFTLPLTTENIFLDKTIKYSYTYRVCGMYSDWCDCTEIEFGFSKVDADFEVEKSSLHAELEVEKHYNNRFKEGKCTYGDIDFRRHRNTYYRNEFPCGTKCKDCGTFWID